jgi:hypothetical protein
VYVSIGQGSTFTLFRINRDPCFDYACLLARQAASLGKGLPTFRKNAMSSSRLKV